MAEEFKPLDELFKEYFPNWVDTILRIEPVSASEIIVTMKDGKKKRFGKKDGVVYMQPAK